jgi:hypothetical protein
MLEAAGAPDVRRELAEAGVMCPDHLIHGDRQPGESVRDYWKRQLLSLKPGVTELYIHAAVASDEMKNITNRWEDRAAEYELFTTDPEIRELIESQGIKLVGYRALRDLQRRGREAKEK